MLKPDSVACRGFFAVGERAYSDERTLSPCMIWSLICALGRPKTAVQHNHTTRLNPLARAYASAELHGMSLVCAACTYWLVMDRCDSLVTDARREADEYCIATGTSSPGRGEKPDQRAIILENVLESSAIDTDLYTKEHAEMESQVEIYASMGLDHQDASRKAL